MIFYILILSLQFSGQNLLTEVLLGHSANVRAPWRTLMRAISLHHLPITVVHSQTFSYTDREQHKQNQMCHSIKKKKKMKKIIKNIHTSTQPLGSLYQKHQSFTKITTIPPAIVNRSSNVFCLLHFESVKTHSKNCWLSKLMQLLIIAYSSALLQCMLSSCNSYASFRIFHLYSMKK